ncbi:NAD-dependent epimerase/dehydratase family protein [Listeria booriae]|uniref:NAD-dependent epimerase/dehydratase family protein n=1 Tax=Listeria booriae TaxID=1552123 RepID=UPI001C8CA031|nr:NAD(P)-dependent oxidoreductase [Listeria booriae]
MKIIVTGATGFLGGYMVNELLENGHQVIAVGRNHNRLVELEKAGMETLTLDLSNRDALMEQWPDADMVIHAAALSTVYGPYKEFYRQNVEVTQNVLYASKKRGLKRFVYVSSPSIYTKRHDHFNIKEQEVDKKNKLNNYIRTKIEAEAFLQKECSDMELVIVRPRGLFGIGDTSIFPRLLKANESIGIPLFKHDNSTIVDVTCVENVAYALRLCCEVDGIDRAIFNITNNEPMSFLMIVERIFSGINKTPRFRKLSIGVIYTIATIFEQVYQLLHIKSEPVLTRYTVCTLAYSQTLDITQAQTKLGYKPRMTLFDGIDKYATHMKQEEL